MRLTNRCYAVTGLGYSGFATRPTHPLRADRTRQVSDRAFQWRLRQRLSVSAPADASAGSAFWCGPRRAGESSPPRRKAIRECIRRFPATLGIALRSSDPEALRFLAAQ